MNRELSECRSHKKRLPTKEADFGVYFVVAKSTNILLAKCLWVPQTLTNLCWENCMHQNWEFILRLLLGGVLGAATGVERKGHYKQAGVRTHFVVAVDSALMITILSIIWLGQTIGLSVLLILKPGNSCVACDSFT